MFLKYFKKSSLLFSVFSYKFLRNFNRFTLMGKNASNISYVQGQSPTPHTREYFYYIDHQGMLFLDDCKMKNFTSCFKDKKFLAFFFKRLCINESGKYEKEFPYVSPCGREMNFIRCDDLPIVFTHVIEINEQNNTLVDWLSYGHAGDLLRERFQPAKLCMLPHCGRLYHPAHESVGGVGLVKSSLTIQLSQYFSYDGDDTDTMPIAFTWKDTKYKLTNEIFQQLKDQTCL